MNREKWKNLTDDQKRIKIAELCGWKVIMPLSIEESCCVISPVGEQRDFIPDYLNDLNAMHDAEVLLKQEDWGTYRQYLDWWTHSKGWNANAAQRAEAFILTMETED